MNTDKQSQAANEALPKLYYIALARSLVYSFISVGFLDPTKKYAQRIINGTYFSELESYYQDLVSQQVPEEGAEYTGALDRLKLLQTAFSDSDLNELLTEMKVEYARLFIGPGRAEIPPYETCFASTQKDSSPLLMVSSQAIAVESAYQQSGVVVSSDLNEPPDHFATETEFLYYLCKKESDSWAVGDNDNAHEWRRQQITFLDGHLCEWGIRFCQDVENMSSHPLYQALAHFTGIFLEMECSEIKTEKSVSGHL